MSSMASTGTRRGYPAGRTYQSVEQCSLVHSEPIELMETSPIPSMSVMNYSTIAQYSAVTINLITRAI